MSATAFEQIKERLTCVEYARRIGLAINKPGDRCVSPLRSSANNKSSFVVYDDYYYDHGDSKGGDVIDFAPTVNLMETEQKHSINSLISQV